MTAPKQPSPSDEELATVFAQGYTRATPRSAPSLTDQSSVVAAANAGRRALYEAGCERYRTAFRNAEQRELAALAELDEARAEIKELRASIEKYRDPVNHLHWRGVMNPCKTCSGSGVRMYGSTSTWHGGPGGQMFTNGVCDRCWGSGEADQPWTNLRKIKNSNDHTWALGYETGLAERRRYVEEIEKRVLVEIDARSEWIERAQSAEASVVELRKELEAARARIKELTVCECGKELGRALCFVCDNDE